MRTGLAAGEDPGRPRLLARVFPELATITKNVATAWVLAARQVSHRRAVSCFTLGKPIRRKSKNGGRGTLPSF
jgi:hypothetical protein